MTNDVTTTGAHRRFLSAATLTACLTIGGLASVGCESDGYLNPSITGYWEHTPTTMPILRRIAAIEPDDSEFVQITDVRPEDLRPLITDYRLVPGDTLVVTIFNYPAQGVNTPFDVRVENNGLIDLLNIGKFFVLGGTSDEVRKVVSDGLIAQDLIRRPEVGVNIVGRSQQQYSVIGSVRAPGPYFIPEPSYRLLDALAAAGGLLDESTAELFVIRQVALADEYSDIGAPAGARTVNPDTGETGNAPESTDRLIDLIDELSQPANENPSIVSSGNSGSPYRLESASLSRLESALHAAEQMIDQPEDREPEVDLIDGSGAQEQPGGERLSPFDTTASQWIFIDGRWVQIKDTPNLAGTLRERADDALEAENLVTQRIISIPADRLMQGDARYNIVVRPGDILRVPSPGSGTIYLSGQFARGGAFEYNPQLTLSRLFAAAGGLGGLAIPERVDITRMVGTDRQATIRVNYKAIADNSEPDIFLKPNDHINVGTNFWAYPLAVVRGGFRASYGFGFLLDRNFGNDVFGAPPNDRSF